jgi:hypothetical protein
VTGPPAILQTLFDLAPAGAERPCANALVSARALARAVLARIERVLPTARIHAPFHLHRGRVDLAILHRDVTLGILLDASEPFGAPPRTGRGSEIFDYAVALAAYPKDHLLDEKPPHVWGLRAYTGFDAGVAFALARPGSIARDVPLDGRRLFANGVRARTPLDGEGITGALVDHLASRYEAIAIAREFPCGGSIADVAVITHGELHLFEIKGASDAAARLATQGPSYDRVATTCTLVTTCNHRSFRNRVPAHWGLIEAATVRGTTRFMQLREPQTNASRDVASLVDLLELGDLRALLRSLDRLGRGSRSVPQLRRALLEAAGEPELASLALRALARRARLSRSFGPLR